MFDAVLAYINHHLEEEISLEQLARFSGYSSFHLHRKLKEELKEPVGNFIMRQRVQKAGYLLSFTNLPVSDIKLLVGYENDSAFSRAFKKLYGMSPIAYRQTQKEKDGENRESYISLKPEVVRLPEQKAILFPSIANYFSKEVYKVWGKAETYIEEAGLKPEDFTYYGIFHDCQHVNEDSLLRYDAAIVCNKELSLPASKYFGAVLPAGKFVKYKFCCPVADYQKMSAQINRHLLGETGLQHKPGASYFKFQHLPQYDHADHLFIEWLIPIN